ncbi:DoxX protein [Flavobacterium resistens]|uniref:DoxX family membrane protein n=1 Tax=Flavobacterium resistens TaxID=443612 RepID=A0A521BI74_9FLAO|nr:DoxX family membrane protein [Flavobacterium resistens]MRX67387.1 DoxX family membrane protein [Flavobacterium resistens]SMO46766.1 DoxX protein [Flavobacterium resistens]
MKELIKIGRIFFGIGVIALGIHQLIIKDFRSEILAPFPAWAHQNSIFPILVGIVLIVAGIIISGVFKIKFIDTKKVCLYLGFGFLASVIASHLPYVIMLSADKTPDFQVWINLLEALTYSGGAFVMAGSFTENISAGNKKNFTSLLEKLIPCGRVFYSILMIVFGLSHFFFAGFIATLVPKWLPAPMFWTYFFGAALVIAGISIIFKILIKPIGLLLAFMLLLFFLFFHIPDAIANPSASGGNEIIRALICLLFCGIALVIALTNDCKRKL